MAGASSKQNGTFLKQVPESNDSIFFFLNENTFLENTSVTLIDNEAIEFIVTF